MIETDEFEQRLQFQRKTDKTGEKQPMQTSSVGEVIITSRER